MTTDCLHRLQWTIYTYFLIDNILSFDGDGPHNEGSSKVSFQKYKYEKMQRPKGLSSIPKTKKYIENINQNNF